MNDFDDILNGVDCGRFRDLCLFANCTDRTGVLLLLDEMTHSLSDDDALALITEACCVRACGLP